MTKAVKLKAVTQWANLTEPNKKSKKYQVNLTRLTPAAVKALKEMGLKVRNEPEKHPDWGSFIIVKSAKRPLVAKYQGVDVSATLGNGSVVLALVGYYKQPYEGEVLTLPSLNGPMNVVEYNEFNGGEVIDENDDEVL